MTHSSRTRIAVLTLVALTVGGASAAGVVLSRAATSRIVVGTDAGSNGSSTGPASSASTVSKGGARPVVPSNPVSDPIVPPPPTLSFAGNTAWMVSADATLLHSSDFGGTWTTDPLTAAMGLPVSVGFASPTVGWLITTTGLYGTSSGGSRWIGISVPSSVAAAQFVDSTSGWILTHGGQLFATNDGGHQWTLVSGALPGEVVAACAQDASHLVVAVDRHGLALEVSSDGGRTWSNEYASQRSAVSAVLHCAGGYSTATVAYGNSMHGGQAGRLVRAPGSGWRTVEVPASPTGSQGQSEDQDVPPAVTSGGTVVGALLRESSVEIYWGGAAVPMVGSGLAMPGSLTVRLPNVFGQQAPRGELGEIGFSSESNGLLAVTSQVTRSIVTIRTMDGGRSWDVVSSGGY